MHTEGTDTAASLARWRTADLEIDVGLQRVARDGACIELPRLSFELLLALLRAAPHFLSNEELMVRVWKGLVVSPETVTQRVKLLRDALGDDPKHPRYIEGLRGRGYRMIPPVRAAEVQSLHPGAPVVATLEGTLAQSPTARNRHRWWVVAVTLAASILAVSLLLWRHGLDTGVQAPVAQDRTAAILPFAVLGGTENSRALAVGLSDSIQVQLSEVSGLQLVVTNSLPASEEVDATSAGSRLGARYIVTGTVQQSGDMLRVVVRLVDSHSGRVLWTNQYDGEVHDFFGMQDAVAAGTMRALESRIAGLDPAVPAGVRSSNVEAQLAYLRGRALLGRTTVVDSVASEREFTRALELDTTFVPAMAGLYDARMQAASLRRSGMQAALAANAPLLQQAAKLQPDSGALQIARAMWGSDAPELRATLFDEGLARDPSNARAMTAYSELLDSMDRTADAGRWLDRALLVDPLWPRAHFRAAQRNFSAVGAAIEQQNLKMLELDPGYYPALQRHAKYRWQMHGEIAYAISVIERAIAADPQNPWAPHTAVAFYLDASDPAAAADVVRGDPVADASTAALRAQYEGDWRKAGEAALAAGSFVFGGAERWGVARALRDYALRGGPRSRIIDLLAQRYSLPLDARWKLGPFNFREAELLANLLLESGQRDQGLRRLDEVIAWIDANAYMGPVYNLRTKAQALALQGHDDAALALLAESFEKMDYTNWWYTLQHDPTWDHLRADPRFVAIAASVRAHVAGQVQRLEQLRREGRIPERGNRRGSPGSKARPSSAA